MEQAYNAVHYGALRSTVLRTMLIYKVAICRDLNLDSIGDLLFKKCWMHAQ